MKLLAISGSSYDIGRQLGEFGREAWHAKLTQTALWQTVTAMGSLAQTAAMGELVKAKFPSLWQEIEGLAEGLQASVAQVFAWNCRGDLVPSTSDGCTTVAGVNAAGERLIAHNEDGFPQLRQHCAMVKITPDEGLSFTSFAYPGSICGHTFAVNEKGIVNTVNNIRALVRPGGLPRQILARAALNAATLDEAIAVLTSPARSGAFHHTLSQMGDNRIFSIEATGSGSSINQLTQNLGHANHLIHARMSEEGQVITASSASRQAKLHAWLATEPQINAAAFHAILSDQSDRDLPIYRLSPEDPDEENTLATALFTLSEERVEWQIFGLERNKAELQGEV
ncbi:C45 family autoproteolytic acyltransferase/hydolase [Kalamiella sp. sgz302252]|uniref:C45 family autoproteolytic acyltransferase/hydolase n=1 Tax=Pantoea sp. sgz302252 TaxID=3341827 RepID=UPI0036D39F57